MKYLRSGFRRDLCVFVHGAGEVRAQQLKTDVEALYDERIPPKRFYGALDGLVADGYLQKREDGLHDAYSLTDAGERRFVDHYEWVRQTAGLD